MADQSEYPIAAVPAAASGAEAAPCATGSESPAPTAEESRKVKKRAPDAGRTAEIKIDERREPAARALEVGAARAAHATAETLQSTADYVRAHDAHSMLADLLDVARNHPTQSIIAAAAAGFVVHRVLRK